MPVLLKLFVDLCRFRAAPQDLPYSQFFMALCIACYTVVGFAISLSEQPFGQSIIIAAADTSLMVGLAYLGLWARDSLPRATQTVTALAGTGTLFELIGWPLVTYLQSLGEGETSLLSLLLLGIVIWNIVVIGHILRHALELPMWVASGIALLYIYTSIRVMSVLYVAGGV
ncbi:hypothetical protein [Kaarinaea lacus]